MGIGSALVGPEQRWKPSKGCSCWRCLVTESLYFLARTWVCVLVFVRLWPHGNFEFTGYNDELQCVMIAFGCFR